MTETELRTRATFFALTLKMARTLGMTEAEVRVMFSPENIASGYQIIDAQRNQQPKES